MSHKAEMLAHQAMCLFHSFDLTDLSESALAEQEWLLNGDKWLEVIMFLREDIITEPPPKGKHEH